MKSEHWYITLDIRCGEYEFQSSRVWAAAKPATLNQADKHANSYAKNFYCDRAETMNDWYYFNGGEVAVRVSNVLPCTPEEAEVLNRFT